eukprot:TRINITY_DN10550_c0_g1_i1.p1 TRINITY_DN10550_c0_g1~~TRINITY_DN10550_c0_g1_i1.p1  ORF type:complete len:238 (-),score=41.31 TRINITY_DN10550_c0_g1_i1:84-797(-)
MEEAGVKVLYETDTILAVSKPGGLIVHHNQWSRKEQVSTLVEQIRSYLNVETVHPIFRLDRPTSGIVIFGKDPETANLLKIALKDPDCQKLYIALSRGDPKVLEWTENTPLNNKSKKDRGIKQPQDAITDFVVLAQFYRLNLIQARIFTGRRHQIRRHLGKNALQIIGDREYGKGRINNFFKDTHNLQRMFLHCREIQFKDPISGEPLHITDPLPDDLRTFLTNLPEPPPLDMLNDL